MVKRKSSAQLKRLQKRAEQRGEIYSEDDAVTATKNERQEADGQPQVAVVAGAGVEDESPPPPNVDAQNENDVVREEEQEEVAEKRAKVDTDHSSNTKDEKEELYRKKMATIETKKKIAIDLKNEIKSIDENKELKAKERRSAKRKAEAIAVEETGAGSAQDLLDWLETYQEEATKKNKDGSDDETKRKKTKLDRPQSTSRTATPNILFVGQLAFDTTKEEILACFRKHLKETEKMKVADGVLSVRLLTNDKTGKSKGMAFLEIKDTDPLILYSCLKLHHTYLKGRRINVERTSGGGKATKQAKVATLRKNQVDYMKETVQSILKEYDTSSLDEGVLALCERHNATVVHAGMERFVETDGPNKENPSAYLSALLQKLATEGIFDRTKKPNHDDNGRSRPTKPAGATARSRAGSNRGRR